MNKIEKLILVKLAYGDYSNSVDVGPQISQNSSAKRLMYRGGAEDLSYRGFDNPESYPVIRKLFRRIRGKS